MFINECNRFLSMKQYEEDGWQKKIETAFYAKDTQ